MVDDTQSSTNANRRKQIPSCRNFSRNMEPIYRFQYIP